MSMPSHVRWIVETNQTARGTKRQALGGYELVVSQQSDAEDEVLNPCEAHLRALTSQRAQRHPTPNRQVTRPTNRPRIDAHRFHQRFQRVESGLGVEDEVGDASGTRSLDEPEQFCHGHLSMSVTAVHGKDVDPRLRHEVEPERADRGVSWNQAERRTSKQWLDATRLHRMASIGQIHDNEIPRPHFVHRRCCGPMSRIDLGLQSAAECGTRGASWTEKVYGGQEHWNQGVTGDDA